MVTCILRLKRRWWPNEGVGIYRSNGDRIFRSANRSALRRPNAHAICSDYVAGVCGSGGADGGYHGEIGRNTDDRYLRRGGRGMTFRVIVAGGRTFTNYALLREKLDSALRNKVNEDIAIVSGTARGADQLGEQYAKERGYTVNSHPADWDQHGKSAGYIRNKEMAQNADALLAFWDGKSRGTKHMIDLAHQHGLKVIVINY
jgi:hypothetical protein